MKTPIALSRLIVFSRWKMGFLEPVRMDRTQQGRVLLGLWSHIVPSGAALSRHADLINAL